MRSKPARAIRGASTGTGSCRHVLNRGYKIGRKVAASRRHTQSSWTATSWLVPRNPRQDTRCTWTSFFRRLGRERLGEFRQSSLNAHCWSKGRAVKVHASCFLLFLCKHDQELVEEERHAAIDAMQDAGAPRNAGAVKQLDACEVPGARAPEHQVPRIKHQQRGQMGA